MTDTAANDIAADAPILTERSITGRVWRDAGAAADRAALRYAQTLGLPHALARLLASRGIAEADALDHLDPTLRRLMPDPSTLTALDDAAARLADAVRAREAVAVFGDYDVDGAASTALMARFLNHYGVPHRVHIPDRITEGYGPNEAAITKLKEGGASLLVTVDCGTSGHAALAHAKGIGLDVLVLDHHQADETLPDVAALVNPNRLDCTSGQGHLCAAGVVFLVLVAVNRLLKGDAEPFDLMGALDLVALATVCDVVPLRDLNRAYVVKGLAKMGKWANPGLAALAEAARVSGPLTPYHLGFALGPRINAGGRIGNAALGTRLLTTDDPREAQTIAAQLDALNQERQRMEADMLAEATAHAQRLVDAEPDTPVLVLHDERWHQGLVGLLASRLKDRFHRPVFAIAMHGDGGTGSGRSVDGIDLGRAVRAAVEAGVLARGGGHAMAAGISVARARIDAFAEFVADAVRRPGTMPGEAPVLAIDASLSARGASVDFVKALERAGPFGAGNPTPTLRLAGHRVSAPQIVGANHVKFRAEQDGASVDAIAFRAADTPLGEALIAGGPLDLAGALRLDRWNGREKASLHLIDAARPA